MAAVRYPFGTIWAEQEIQVGKLRRFDEGAGKTGKGIVHCWEARSGRYRAFDVEDVVGIRRSGRKSR